MRRWMAIAGAALAVGGCALGTGVIPVGPDTYLVSALRAPAVGGGAEAQRVVLAEASGFCRQQGRVVLPLDLRTSLFVALPRHYDSARGSCFARRDFISVGARPAGPRSAAGDRR